MSVFVVAQIQIRDPAAYEPYRRDVPAIVQRYGGRYLARGGRSEALEGPPLPGRSVLLEFPSREAYDRFLASPEYAPYRALRAAHAESQVFVVEGLPGQTG
jgi:uncharacterized protein (DUF1330 family)